MGEKLELISGEEAVRKFVRAGWTVARRRGSHIMLTKPGFQWTLSVPDHQLQWHDPPNGGRWTQDVELAPRGNSVILNVTSP